MKIRYAVAAAAWLALPAAGLAQDQAAKPWVSAYQRFSTETAAVADPYFNAYIAMDWAKVEALAADNISVRDPTAARLFGAAGAEGKATVMHNFRTTYAGLKGMRFETTRTIHSGDLAIYEGALEWTLDMRDGRDVTSVTPMVIVLEVSDGKVVSHRDYVDYAPFVEAERASRPARKAQ